MASWLTASFHENLVLITGPSESGLGAQTAVFLAAANPELILLAGRTESKIQPVIAEINKSYPDVAVKFVKLDLADLSSIHAAAKEVSSQVDKLDVLINNAGGKSSCEGFNL